MKQIFENKVFNLSFETERQLIFFINLDVPQNMIKYLFKFLVKKLMKKDKNIYML